MWFFVGMTLPRPPVGSMCDLMLVGSDSGDLSLVETALRHASCVRRTTVSRTEIAWFRLWLRRLHAVSWYFERLVGMDLSRRWTLAPADGYSDFGGSKSGDLG